ncbi:MAG: BNR repeat-containing protein [Pirellulaceae bacterium]|nr:BNR repeat-containing protein [Pirellulaceae bacterium]
MPKPSNPFLPPTLWIVLGLLLLTPLSLRAESRIRRIVDVAPVWSGHPVRFALLTHGKRQFVAFYDADRHLTVAARTLDLDQWDFQRLPTQLGWDSHNYVTLAADDDGHLHLSGNMHCVPLIYFRTQKAEDVRSFERVPAMVGRNEQRCTYPRFLTGAQGELIFTYRDGSSGNGDQFFNVYDPASRTWRRLLDEPLFTGEGLRNAYFHGPVRDSAGIFHLCWVWRDTPDCATNHDLCYARSRDLVHWETSDGTALGLPISLASAEIVDPVPAQGGLINGNTVIGFDGQGRVVLSYHKFDPAGNTQLYNARREDAGWKIYQTSDWDYRWEFNGGGTIVFEIGFGPVSAAADGSLTQDYHHAKHGSGRWRLDAATLRAAGPAPREPSLPSPVLPKPSDWPELRGQTAHDSGHGDDPGLQYLLRWETLPSNRDRPRSGPLPPPSMLKLYEVER